jgi:hypothetical protein
MKRAFALTLLLMSFASVAFADGGGLPPNCTVVNWKVVCQEPPQADAVLLADGSGLPPAATTKPTKPGLRPLADGSGLPPVAQKLPQPEIAV